MMLHGFGLLPKSLLQYIPLDKELVRGIQLPVMDTVVYSKTYEIISTLKQERAYTHVTISIARRYAKISLHLAHHKYKTVTCTLL